MTQEIQAEDIKGVLLPDGWHEVKEGSFNPDSPKFPGSNGEKNFAFTDLEYADEGSQVFITRVTGPVSSIRAVRG